MHRSTPIHLRYALGYMTLGMFRDAADELAAVESDDWLTPEVLSAKADLYTEARQWEHLLAVGHELASIEPDAEHGWISWAYALRELGRIAEAKAVLLTAAPRHQATSALLHYNLACYHALLGEPTQDQSLNLLRLKSADFAFLATGQRVCLCHLSACRIEFRFQFKPLN